MKKASVTCGTTTVTCGTTLNCLIYVYLEAQKERDWGRKYISRNNGQTFSKIDENIKHLDPRILMNPKKKKTKKSTHTHKKKSTPRHIIAEEQR